MQGIYTIMNLVNGTLYVGSSVSAETRWARHRRDFTKGTHGNQYLQRAVRKYGLDKFRFRIEEVVEAGNELRETEYQWIDVLEKAGFPLYNSRKHDPRTGQLTCSAGTRARISMAHKGKVFSAAHRAKIGAANSRRVISSSTRAKIGASKRGNQNVRGQKRTPEQRDRMRVAALSRGQL